MSATTACRRPPPAVPTRARLALAVADANWYTTEHLFGELHRPDVATLLLRCVDYVVAWRRGEPPWSWGRRLEQAGPGLWRRDLVLPSGWMKRFPRLGMRPIRRAIASWRSRAPSDRLGLVMTYPHYLYLRDLVRPDLHVYFNIDDYTLYWPHRAERIDALERRAVRESDLTVCVSRLRCEQLRRAVPEAADRVRHLPHGTPSPSLASAPFATPGPAPGDLAVLPRPWIGYVGTLEDRVDWPLMIRLADALPSASIVLIGRLDPAAAGPWVEDRRRCLSRPNVHHLGWRPQEAIGRYNAAFDACLIPYRVDHPFNRACCPTKIMDYMGTGRPIVSTALPECSLYEHLFDVAPDADAFLAALRRILAAGSDDGRAAARHDWARANTCERVVERFLSWLPEA
jgi:teichuronic acid biosynthesis glycosyltransferase TuaH